MKKLYPILILCTLIVITSCTKKKKTVIPLFAALAGEETSTPVTFKGSDEKPVETVPETKPTTTNGTNSVVVSSENTSFTISNNQTTGSNSGSGNTSGNQSGIISSGATEGSSGNSDNSFTIAPTEPTQGSDINDVYPSACVVAAVENNFLYQTTVTVPVDFPVKDINGNTIPNALVAIRSATGDLLLQQLSNLEGRIIGSIIVPSADPRVEVTISVNSQTTHPVPIPLEIFKDSSSQTIQAICGLTLPFAVDIDPNLITDSDGDGVEDSQDYYPNDPSRSALVRFPNNGINTIAFEDLYPNPGDADLNDFVLYFYTEEDLNAEGKIVEIRGAYQHVARGAGYRHTLNLLPPSGINLQFERIVLKPDGEVIDNKPLYAPTEAELENGLELVWDSSKTGGIRNVDLGAEYKEGYITKFRILFNTPVDRSVLGNSPYNLYAYVFNTDRKIFFPGRYFDENGQDKYMDTNGFPYAIMVPGQWAWQLERKDIRNPTSTDYPKFQDWAVSKGSLYKDWYLYKNGVNSFSTPEGLNPVLLSPIQ